MKILLLNNNPVVNKLVTLSAQKTSNILDIADSVEAVESKNYDILIVDDALYSEDAMKELGNKIEFSKSLYICSKDAKPAEEFTRTLKKPFLPTDLVELLIFLVKEADTINLDKLDKRGKVEEVDESLDTFDEIEDLNEIEDLDKIEDFDEIEDLDELEGSDEGEINFDDFDESLDDDLGEEVKDFESTQKMTDSILDKDELQEVQNLLEETEAQDDAIEDTFDDLEFGNDLELGDDLELGEDELKLEEDTQEDLDFDEEIKDDLELEEAASSDELKNLDDEAQVLEDDLTLDDSDIDALDFDEEESLEKHESNEAIDELDELDELDDLESQIESAVKELSDEDLQSEVDGNMLLDIDSLTSRDLKLAIGEEVNDEEFDESGTIDEVEPHDEELAISNKEEFNDSVVDDFDKKADTQKESSDNSNDGVEALKKLLKALSNEDVAASLKGMKININITLGDR